MAALLAISLDLQCNNAVVAVASHPCPSLARVDGSEVVWA